MEVVEEVKHSQMVHNDARKAILNVLNRRKANGRQAKVGVEIGVQYGLGSEMWLEAGVVKKMYGVDPFDTSIYPVG